MNDFPPSRDAALARLADFVPHAGFDYARLRNFDTPGHSEVSRLSPYLRHRLITEEEVLRATLAQHSREQASKFIDEVIWRTYWKGVLELRPALWTNYKADLNAAWNQVQTNGGLRADWEAACKGEIANTLSWRWVGGLQTKGKTYLARPDNIAKFTQGRFTPKGLADHAVPLEGPDLPALGPVPPSDPSPKSGKIGLLITTEDLSPDFTGHDFHSIAALAPVTQTDPLLAAPKLRAFQANCISDVEQRLGTQFESVTDVGNIVNWAQNAELNHVVMAYAPIGFVADRLTGLRAALQKKNINLSVQIRQYDTTAWPKATHGFFRFKKVADDLTSDF